MERIRVERVGEIEKVREERVGEIERGGVGGGESLSDDSGSVTVQ